jgi:hypothetical protein
MDGFDQCADCGHYKYSVTNSGRGDPMLCDECRLQRQTPPAVERVSVSCTFDHPPEWPCLVCGTGATESDEYQKGYDAGRADGYNDGRTDRFGPLGVDILTAAMEAERTNRYVVAMLSSNSTTWPDDFDPDANYFQIDHDARQRLYQAVRRYLEIE